MQALGPRLAEAGVPAIIAMQGRPALALTTEFVDELLAEVFHADTDTSDQVEPARIASIARALEALIFAR